MREYRLGDIIEIKHGYAFAGEHIVQEDNGIVLVTPGNFRIGGGFQEDKCKFFTGDIPREYVLSAGDFIVTMTDLSKTIDTLGYSALVPQSERTYLHNQRIGLVSFKNDECYPGYIYYLMRTHLYQRSIANTSTGATVHHTSPSKIYNYSFKAPKYNMQKKIADCLFAYDDLIENNQKQIRILEEAAQRLYKEWFVNLRFPGHEDVAIVDGVPEGWSENALQDVAILKAGGDRPQVFSKERNLQCSIPVYSNGTEKEGLYGYTDSPVIQKDCVTISARGSVGYTCLRREAFVPIVRLISVIPKSIDVIYLYLYLKNFKFDSNGAAQQQITVPMIKNKPVLIPTKEVLDDFAKIVHPMQDAIENCKAQVERLVEARDRLLPKLMSGEIEV